MCIRDSFNTSSFPKFFFRLVTWILHCLSSTVYPPLDSLGNLTERYDDNHIHDTNNRPGLQTLQRISHNRLTNMGKLREANDRQNRGCLLYTSSFQMRLHNSDQMPHLHRRTAYANSADICAVPAQNTVRSGSSPLPPHFQNSGTAYLSHPYFQSLPCQSAGTQPYISGSLPRCV